MLSLRSIVITCLMFVSGIMAAWLIVEKEIADSLESVSEYGAYASE